MISLSGLSAVPGGYQQGQVNLLALAQKQAEQDAQTAYGQALQALAGQSGIPTAPQLPVTRQGLGAPIAPPMPRLAPQQPAPASNPLQDALRAKGLTNVQSTALTPPQAPAPARPPQAAQAPAASTAQPAQPQVNLPSAAGVQPGTLTWPAIVNAIKAANPKISPAALAGAVDKFMPLMQDTEAQKWKQIAAQQSAQQSRQAGIPSGYRRSADGNLEAIPGGPADNGSDPNAIAQAIVDGTQPPVLTGLYGKSAAVKTALAKQGFDLSKATTEWAATQAFVKNNNATTQQNKRESVGTAQQSIEKLRSLVEQWNGSQLPALNRKTLDTYKASGDRLATLLDAQIGEVTSTLGAAIMGGNSPTDHSLSLAATQLKGDWNRDTLSAAIDQAQDNLQYRLNAMDHVGVAGLGSEGSRYAPPASSAGSAGAAPRQVTKQEYDQLSPGTHYLDPDGSEWIKH